jgi:hypothetical protein
MKKTCIIVFLLVLITGCYLKVQGHNPTSEYLKMIPVPSLAEVTVEEIKGRFTLILYGANHINDLETIAIMDYEGDNIKFEPYAPDFSYRKKFSVTPAEAIKEAVDFVSWHNAFNHYEIKRIVNRAGSTLGFEIRPLYDPLTFGATDVLDVDYILEGDKVKVLIKLKPQIERRIFDGEDKTFDR